MWDAMWLTAMSGTSSATANILAALTPMSRAPTRPGVLCTATQPICASCTPAFASASSTTGSSRCKWARAATSGTTPPKRACKSVCEATMLDRTTGSAVKTAAAVSSQDVSRARKKGSIAADIRATTSADQGRLLGGGRRRHRRSMLHLAALCGPGLPARALPEEGQRVLVDDLADDVLPVAAPLHLLGELRHREGIRLAPV